MKIEHIAMYVNNLEEVRDFFVKYLGDRKLYKVNGTTQASNA